MSDVRIKFRLPTEGFEQHVQVVSTMLAGRDILFERPDKTVVAGHIQLVKIVPGSRYLDVTAMITDEEIANAITAYPPTWDL